MTVSVGNAFTVKKIQNYIFKNEPTCFLSKKKLFDQIICFHADFILMILESSHPYFFILNNLKTTKPLMNTNSFAGRRRSTRNRTIVIDPKDLQIEEPTIHAEKSFSNFQVKKEEANSEVIGTRTFEFMELMNAFKTIEKRSREDPFITKNALKRFKMNDESAVEVGCEDEKRMIASEIFPKIMENPFLRNDFEVPLDKIEKENKKISRFQN